MANFVFNIAKGKVAYYAGLPAANDALLVVPIEASGLEADDTLNNYDDLAALLAGTNNEQTTMNRKTGITASVTVTVDDTNNWVDVDLPDQTWVGATGNAIGALLICYDPDTTSGTDSSIIPLSKHDFSVTPDGSDVIAQIASSGFYRAS